MRTIRVSYLKLWYVQVVLLILSPLGLLGLLIFLEVLFASNRSPLYLSIVWSVTALAAVVVSAILAFNAWQTFRYAWRHYNWEQARLLIPAVNFMATSGFLFVHMLFLAVGVGSIRRSPPPTPDEDHIDLLLARIGLLEGQYILLIVGVVSFVMYRKIRHNISREIDYEEAHRQVQDNRVPTNGGHRLDE